MIVDDIVFEYFPECAVAYITVYAKYNNRVRRICDIEIGDIALREPDQFNYCQSLSINVANSMGYHLPSENFNTVKI